MFTNLSLWMIYTASYLLDYVAILILFILKNYNEFLHADVKISFLKYISTGNYIIFACVLLLIAFSIICTERVDHHIQGIQQAAE